MQDRYLTVNEVAKMLNISYDTALHYVKYSLESVKIGRQYRVRESKLNAVLYPEKSVRKITFGRPIYQIVDERGCY